MSVAGMKIKVTIRGPRVHDVGYRVFLGRLAMGLALPGFLASGFLAYNWEEEGQQEVIALAEGDPERIAAFRKLIDGKKPILAEVSERTFEDYDGDVGRTGEYAQLLSFEQLDKAIPILLDVRDGINDVKAGINDVKTGINDVKAGIDDMKTGIDDVKTGVNDVRMAVNDVKTGVDEVRDAVKVVAEKQDESRADIVGEVRELRRGLGISIESRLSRVEKDIDELKAKMGQK